MKNEHYLKDELYKLMKKDESIFEFIQEVCLDGLWYWDMEKPENEWMNKRFWDVLGYDSEEMPQSPDAWRNIINQDDLKIATENLYKHLDNENKPYDQIVRYKHKKGNTVWIRCFGKAIRDVNGKPLRMLGVHNDISQLKTTIDFQTLVTKISTRFIDSDEDSFDFDINNTLSSLGNFFKVDRSYLFLFSDDLKSITNTHNWCAPDIRSQIENIQNYPNDSMPWFTQRIKTQDYLYIPRVEDLPSEASSEKLRFRELEIKSLISISIKDSERIWGFICFDSVNDYFSWSNEEISSLKTISNIISSLLRKIKNEREKKQTEKKLKENEVKLKERIKEITLLQSVSQIIQEENHLKSIFQKVVFDAPKAWCYPEIACARITFEGQSYQTENVFRETEWRLSADIKVEGKSLGTVEIFYLEERPIKDEGPFIKKETSLINLCAEKLGRAIEHMRSKEALVVSLQRLEFALQGGELGVWDWNPQNDAAVYSDQWGQMLEYQPDEILPSGEFFKKHIHPDDLTAVLDRLTEHVEGRLPVYESEHRMRTKSGRWLWVLDRGKIVVQDQNGCPVRVTGLIANITNHKQAEDELKKFKTISDIAVYGKAISDLQGNIIYINKFFANIHGYEPEELIGKNFSLFHSQEQMVEVERLNITMIQEGYYNPTTVWHRHKNGTLFPMLMNGIILKDDYGTPQYLAASSIDITALKNAEKEKEQTQTQLMHQEKLASIGTLAAGVAHEINNPLAIIIGNIDALTRECKDMSKVKCTERIAIASKACDRIAAIVNGLRNYARSDNDTLETIDIHQAIGDTVNIVKTIFSKESVSIETDLKCATPQIKSNMGKLQQVIMNILTNAKDAIKEAHDCGIIKLTTLECNDTVSISISDNGSGMDEKQKEKIFDPFYTTKDPNKGTGLGLAISNTIIKDLGGTIGVESEKNIGTTFTITLSKQIKKKMSCESIYVSPPNL